MTDQITLEPGSDEWERWRTRCTEPKPGEFSALYWLNANVLGHAQLGDFQMTPSSHYALCLFAERATGINWVDDAQVHLMLMPRGTGKSSLVTKGLTIQKLLANTDYAVGIANETMDLAKKFLAGVKAEFEQNELLQNLFPERIPDSFEDTTWTAEEIILPREKPRPKDPSVKAVGAGKTVTGVHMDRWILDDLISRDLAENAIRGLTTEIDKMERWITQLPPLLGDPNNDPIDVCATPWYAGDTYDFMLKFFGNLSSEADIRDVPPDKETIWRFRLPNGEIEEQRLQRWGDIALFKKPAYDENGRSVFPWKWTTEELNKMKSRPKTAQFFAANFELEPTKGLATYFDPADLKQFEWNGNQSGVYYYDQRGDPAAEAISEMRLFISVDPAFTDDASNARTAIPVVGSNGTEIFLLEDFADHGLGVYDIARELARMCMEYGMPDRIFLETISAQTALAEPIRRELRDEGFDPMIEEISSHSDRKKKMRIMGLERWVERGLFYHHSSQNKFLKEFESFPRGQLQDILDALSFQKGAWEETTRTLTQTSTRRQREVREAHEDAANRMAESLNE